MDLYNVIEEAMDEAKSLNSKLYTYQLYSPQLRRRIQYNPEDKRAKRLLRKLILLPPVPCAELDRPINRNGEEIDSYIGLPIEELEEEGENKWKYGIVLVEPWKIKPQYDPYENGSEVTVIDTVWDEERTYTLKPDTCHRMAGWAASGPIPSITEDYFHEELKSERLSAEDNIMDTFAEHRDEMISLSDTDFRVAHQELYDKYYETIRYGHENDIPVWVIEKKCRPVVEKLLQLAYKEYRESTIELYTFLGVLLRFSNRYGLGTLTEDGKYDFSVGPNKDLKLKYRQYLLRLEMTVFDMVDPGQGFSDWVTEQEIPEHELKESVNTFLDTWMEQIRRMFQNEKGEDRGWIEYKTFEAYLRAVNDNQTPHRAGQITKKMRSDLIKELRTRELRRRKKETSLSSGKLVRDKDKFYLIQNGVKYKISQALYQKKMEELG